MSKLKIKLSKIKKIQIMKNLILILSFILTTQVSFGQSIFDKFEDNDDVTTVVINKKMFEMISSISEEVDGDDAKEFTDVAKNIAELKIFTTEKASVATEMYTVMQKYIASEKLVELMRIKDKGQSVKVYVREGNSENFVKELIMYVKDTSGQSVLMTLTGNIDLRKIGKIADKVKGAESLKNIKVKTK